MKDTNDEVDQQGELLTAATYRVAPAKPSDAPLPVWFRVPGRLSSIMLAFSTGVLLAVLGAALHHALGPEDVQNMGPDGSVHVAFGERVHAIAALVMVIGYPLLFPALFRLSGRRVGRGPWQGPASGGSVFEGRYCVAAYRPDARLFGYAPNELTAARRSQLGISGLLRVPLPVWGRLSAVALIGGLLLLLLVSALMRDDGLGLSQLAALPVFFFLPLLFHSFDSWTVQGSRLRDKLRFASIIPLHRRLRASIEAARDATAERWWRRGEGPKDG